jgi:CMP/dCMP kinase
MTALAHVAIDGPAGSGKTTVARALARRLGILYLDTGAMYRAVAWEALRAGADPGDGAAVVELARLRPVRAVLDRGAPQGFRVFAGERELGEELYANEVSRAVSAVAAHPGVRELMVDRQRAIAAEDGPVVMAGRDIGTVVLPTAPVKVYLTASVEARVVRRGAELAEHGVFIDATELRRQIVERDRLDAGRDVAPLRPAPDAVPIDSTRLSVEQVVEAIVRLIERNEPLE